MFPHPLSSAIHNWQSQYLKLSNGKVVKTLTANQHNRIILSTFNLLPAQISRIMTHHCNIAESQRNGTMKKRTIHKINDKDEIANGNKQKKILFIFFFWCGLVWEHKLHRYCHTHTKHILWPNRNNLKTVISNWGNGIWC